MNSDIKLFEFEKQKVETIFIDNKPIFNPLDVAKCLDLKESSLKQYLWDMDNKERLDMHKLPPEILTNLKFTEDSLRYWLQEPGLYQLILKSRKKTAQKFTKWVTHEVLPSIRKTGGYAVEPLPIDHDKQILDQIIGNAENLLGMRRREIAINQNESWNMKLAKLIWDVSKQDGTGNTEQLYKELVFLFAGETGVNIEEVAEGMGMTRRNYLIKNPTLCKTLYEYAVEHFYGDSRQVVLLPVDQTRFELGE